MRWPFRSSERRGAGSGTDETSATTDPAPTAVAAPPTPPAWSTLPALVPSTPTLAPVAAPVRFARDLTVRRSPELAVEQLGHDVHADGPVGIVGGLVRPAPTIGSAHALPVAMPVAVTAPAAGAPSATVARRPTVDADGWPLTPGGFDD